MYQIKCDDYILYDYRDDALKVANPKVNIEVNKVGEASFTIYQNHPHFDKLRKLKSVFEVSDEIGVIFRGRMTNDTVDFNNAKAVDLEGSMAFFNDSIIRPFAFPGDFLNDAEYTDSSNVVEFFLEWLINQHNSQVQDFQKFRLGRVTVSDPNNYIVRSAENYANTWETLKSKLFDSELGGYLCIRYEADGNYIDYLADFELTNTQDIVFGENLLNLVNQSDATSTYSAIIPIGAEVEKQIESTDEEGNTVTATVKEKVTVKDIADGNITDDIVKSGDTLFSKSAVEKYGWIYAPINETTWQDVTIIENLLSKSIEYLSTNAVMLSNSIDISAVDLHFSDPEIRSFRIYRNINVRSAPHGHSAAYQLTKLSIDLLNPQNTKITVGAIKKTLTDINADNKNSFHDIIDNVKKELDDNDKTVNDQLDEIRETVRTQSTEIINSCESIIFSALDKYVETSNYEEFKETVESQLKIMADQITMNFTATIEQIQNVDGDLQSKFSQLYKYFDFGIEGLTISAGENKMALTIDNDIVSFKKNGQQFGWWDGIDFHTGNIVIDVTERAQFGNFAFVPRSDGSLSFLKVSD